VVDKGVRAVSPVRPGFSAIGWQLAVALFCLVLGGEEHPKSLAGQGHRNRIYESGYPDSIKRMNAVLLYHYSAADLSNPSHVLNEPLEHIVAFHKFAAEHPFE
jgi:hypothetical protein